MGNTNSRTLFNEFLQSSYSRKFRPAKYKRYTVFPRLYAHSHIRIRGNSIYVHGKLHGRVLNHKFERVTQEPNSPSSRSNSPIVQQGQLSSHNVQVTPAVDESNVSSVDDMCPQHTPSVSVSTDTTPVSPTESSALPPQS